MQRNNPDPEYAPMPRRSDSLLSRNEKIAMIGGGVVLAAAFIAAAYVGVSAYLQESSLEEHQRACAEDRARGNRPDDGQMYTIPQGCYYDIK